MLLMSSNLNKADFALVLDFLNIPKFLCLGKQEARACASRRIFSSFFPWANLGMCNREPRGWWIVGNNKKKEKKESKN